MPRRRVEVVIDLNLGDITVPDGPVEIPAQIRPNPRNNSSTRESGDSDDENTWQDDLTAILSPGLARNIINLINNIAARWQGLQRIFLKSGWIAVVALLVMSFIAALKNLQWQVQVAVAAFRVLAQVLLRVVSRALQLVVQWAQRFAQAVWSWAVQSLDALVKAAEKTGRALVQYLVRGLQQTTAYFAEFEQAVAGAVAVMGKTGPAAAQARRDVAAMANQMSTTSRYSGLELALSMQEVAKAGYEDVKSLREVTNAGRILSEATLEPLDNTTRTLISTMAAFQMEADQSMRVTNALAAAANQSIADVSDLAEALKYAGPMAHMYGEKLEGTLAAIMAMSQQGAKGSTAGTQFAMMFNTLLKQTKVARAEFARFGVDLSKITPTNMSMFEIIEAFEDIERRIGRKNLIAIMGRGFDARAIRGFAALLNIGSRRLREMQASITGTNDALQMQREQMNTLQGGWLSLQNLWKSIQTEILQGGLGAAFGDFVRWVHELVAGLREAGIFDKVAASLAKVAGAVVLAVKGMGPTLTQTITTIVDMLPGIAEKIMAAVERVAPVVQSFVGWLPVLAGQVATRLIPALLELAMRVLPLLVELATRGLPIAVNILVALATAVTQLLASNGQALVQLFLNWGGAILTVLQSLPQVIPYLQSFLAKLLQLPGLLAQVVTTWLPVLVRLLAQALVVAQQWGLTMEQVGGVWLPWLYEGMVQLWGFASPAIGLLLEMMDNLLMLMQGFADLLPTIAALVVLLTSPLIVLVAIGSTIAGIIALIAEGMQAVKSFLRLLPGGELLAAAMPPDEYWRGISETARAMQRAGAISMKGWAGMLPMAMEASGPLRQAATYGRQGLRYAEAGREYVDRNLPSDWDALRRNVDQWRERQTQWGPNSGSGAPGPQYYPPAPNPRSSPAGASGQTNISNNFGVPPDWDAVKRRFGEWAEEQKQRQQRRLRTGANLPPGFEYAPPPFQTALPPIPPY